MLGVGGGGWGSMTLQVGLSCSVRGVDSSAPPGFVGMTCFASRLCRNDGDDGMFEL